METDEATNEAAPRRKAKAASEETAQAGSEQVEMALERVSEEATEEARSETDQALEPEEHAEAQEPTEDLARMDRKRLEEQLEALKRKEAELRRALAIADHPALAEAIRELEGCAFSVSRAEAKMAQGLSKSEERRRETLEKKVSGLREKRGELDAQIQQIEAELAELGELRTQAFETERRDAMQRLIATLGMHQAALNTAGLEAAHLVPELARWMPEIIALAEQLVKQRDIARA
jgi:hypothetical protein